MAGSTPSCRRAHQKIGTPPAAISTACTMSSTRTSFQIQYSGAIAIKMG